METNQTVNWIEAYVGSGGSKKQNSSLSEEMRYEEVQELRRHTMSLS